MQMLAFHDLGLVRFDKFMHMQNMLWEQRVENQIPDTILFAEHPVCISLGARSVEFQLPHIRVPQSELVRRDIRVFKTRRGGSLTIHAPGILGCYVIAKCTNVVNSVRSLELLARDTFKHFGVDTASLPNGATNKPQYHGAWTGKGKIASIGMHIARGVTRFGLNINVNTEHSLLTLVHPCGIEEYELTTMAQMGCSASVSDVALATKQVAASTL